MSQQMSQQLKALHDSRVIQEVEAVIQGVWKSFRFSDMDMFVGPVIFVPTRDGGHETVLSTTGERAVPGFTVNWNPPVGCDVYVAGIPPKYENEPWRLVPLGLASAEARAKSKDQGMPVPDMADGEWIASGTMGLVLEFHYITNRAGKRVQEEYGPKHNRRRRDKIVSSYRGKRVVLEQRNLTKEEIERLLTGSADGGSLKVWCVVSENLKEITARSTGITGRKALDMARAQSERIMEATTMAKKKIEKPPFTDEHAFVALGLDRETATFTELNRKVRFLIGYDFDRVTTEEQALKDPVFAAMKSVGYEFSCPDGTSWWQYSPILEDRKRPKFGYIAQAKDLCVPVIKVRTDAEKSLKDAEKALSETRNRPELTDGFMALGLTRERLEALVAEEKLRDADKPTKACVKRVVEELRRKSFKSEEEASADSVFAVMIAAGYGLECPDGVKWWEYEPILIDRAGRFDRKNRKNSVRGYIDAAQDLCFAAIDERYEAEKAEAVRLAEAAEEARVALEGAEGEDAAAKAKSELEAAEGALRDYLEQNRLKNPTNGGGKPIYDLAAVQDSEGDEPDSSEDSDESEDADAESGDGVSEDDGESAGAPA